jgi:hypothetical protein
MHHKNNPKFDPDQTLLPAVSGALDRATLGIFRTGMLTSEAASMNPSGTSARTIIELNIAHYRNLLKDEADASKRRTIAKLLAEEEAKLAKLLAQEDKDE